jgi:hypothetical protein
MERKGIKAVIVLAMVAVMGNRAGAWDTRKNPDVAPSIGWGLHGGHLAGFTSDNARYTEFGADVRTPITNYLTLTIDFAQTTVSNAPLGVSTEANRIGASFRVYLKDFLEAK